MAAIIRVKRRVDEDPAEALIISCKRPRQDPEILNTKENLTLTYAGTLSSKNAPVSLQIRDAIRKQKLQAQYKQHNVDITKVSRAENRAAVKASRYKIISSKRATELDTIDQPSSSENCKEQHKKGICTLETVSDFYIAKDVEKLDIAKDGKNTDLDELKNKLGRESHSCAESEFCIGKVQGLQKNVLQTREDTCVKENLDPIQEIESECVFCLYDVEEDKEFTSTEKKTLPHPRSPSASGITCNGVELLSQRMDTFDSAQINSYVYDLYYTNGGNVDFKALENILYIEALHDELELHNDREEDCDEVYDDDDDSNDESNWRNDYPDEDPRFFENENAEYTYGEDMLLLESHSFDYGDDISEWMSSRCNIDEEDNLPGSEENLIYTAGGRHVSYESYMHQRETHSSSSNESSEEY